MIYPEGPYTVLHFQPVTGRWHVEETDAQIVWTTDHATALALAMGYAEVDLQAMTIRGAAVAPIVEHLPNRGAMVLPLGVNPHDLI